MKMVERLGANPVVSPGSAGTTAKAAPAKDPASSTAFRQILEQACKEKEVIFSAHARSRLEQRQIKLNREDLQKITEAMNKAAAKGVRSPLLLYNNIALLANVPNRTIITAVDGAAEKEQIYTHIDSAVIFT